MKKYFLFSLFLFSFLFLNNKNVFAGGGWHVEESCTKDGWQMTQCLIVEPFSCHIYTGNVGNPGELVTIINTVNGECPVCGNGTKEGNEQCDDGNTNNNDGCSSTCQYDDQEGDLQVKLKTYDCNGNEESKKIEGSKVKLYERDGDKVETDKTNSKGEANFRDIETGKYKVKCEVDGYVSMKDRNKTAYESGYEKVKDGKKATETCRLIKKSCNGKLAVTGGSLFDYVLSLVF